MKHLLTIAFALIALTGSAQIQGYQMPVDTNPVYQLIADYPIDTAVEIAIWSDYTWSNDSIGDWVYHNPEPTITMTADTVCGLVVYVQGKRVKVDYGCEITHIKNKRYSEWPWDEDTIITTSHIVGKKKEYRWNVVKFIPHELN